MSAPSHPAVMPWDDWNEMGLDASTARGLRLIGRLVRRRRQINVLSQQQLEQLSGIDQSAISRLENGRLLGLRWSRFARLVAVLGGLDEMDPPIWR